MPIVKIALAGIALGVCVMLLSILIITGFKNEITTKLSGFMAHLSITAYDHEDAYSGSEIERFFVGSGPESVRFKADVCLCDKTGDLEE